MSFSGAFTFPSRQCTAAIRALYAPCVLSLAISTVFASTAHGARLGELQVKSAIGDAFLAHIPVMMSSGERLGPGCVGISPSQSDDINANLVRDLNIRLVDGAGTQKMLIISSDSRIREPAFQLAVRVGCDASITRQYVAFLEPPVVADNAWPAPSTANQEEPLRFSLQREASGRLRAAGSDRTEANKPDANTRDDRPRRSRKPTDRKVAPPETFKMTASLMPVSVERAQQQPKGPAPTGSPSADWLKSQQELLAMVSLLSEQNKQLTQDRAGLSAQVAEQRTRLQALQDSTVSRDLMRWTAGGAGVLGMLMGVLAARLSRRRTALMTEPHDAKSQSESVHLFESLLTQPPLQERSDPLLDVSIRSGADGEPMVSSAPAAIAPVDAHVPAPNTLNDDPGMTFTVSDNESEALHTHSLQHAGFELEEVHQLSTDHQSVSEVDATNDDEGLDEDVQATLSWLDQGMQALSQPMGDCPGGQSRSILSVAPVAAWFIGLFDSDLGSDQGAECVKQIKTYFVTHDDTPFALWSVWMNWLERQGYQNLLKALRPRFEERFGIAYAGGELSDSQEQLPDMIVDMLDLYVDQAASRGDRDRLLMQWLDSRNAPSYVVNRPDVFIAILKHIQPPPAQAEQGAFEGLNAGQAVQG